MKYFVYPLSGIRKEAAAWDKIFTAVRKRFPKLAPWRAKQVANQIWGHKLTGASENLLRSRAARGVPEATEKLKAYEASSYSVIDPLPLQNVRNPSDVRNAPYNYSFSFVSPQELSEWRKRINKIVDPSDRAMKLKGVRELQRGYRYTEPIQDKLFVPTTSKFGPGGRTDFDGRPLK